MKTPILNFVKSYAESDMSRLHMPGHKGKSFLGCESFDITEIKGADSLYEADGIIAESESYATELFGSAKTLFSTEGSSQCIRAMMYLAMLQKKQGKRPVVVAARNVHKTFIYAATLLDFDVIWLWPEEDAESICSCPISLSQLEKVLSEHKDSVIAVYLTSPDYLGGLADVRGISELCHQYGTILAIDNAHGAYLKFLKPSQHPLDLGADICCDSAHKTLPVLTGGAYLHISKNAPKVFCEQAKYAMNLFGSTSPSYLIMASLDFCNQYLSEGYQERLGNIIQIKENYCEVLRKNGWRIRKSEPLKITIEIPRGVSEQDLASKLRDHNVEYEYADTDYIVFMVTPENEIRDLERIVEALGKNEVSYCKKEKLPAIYTKAVMSIREAMFSMPETVPVQEALGRICRVPTVSCPPAIPIAVPGELIDETMIELFTYYGVMELDVVKN